LPRGQLTGEVGFEDWKRTGNRDIVIDQQLDESGGLWTIGVILASVIEPVSREQWSGCLSGSSCVLRRNRAPNCRYLVQPLRIGDRTEMAGHLHMMSVCRLHRGSKLSAREMHIRLEVGRTGRRPEVDELLASSAR